MNNNFFIQIESDCIKISNGMDLIAIIPYNDKPVEIHIEVKSAAPLITLRHD